MKRLLPVLGLLLCLPLIVAAGADQYGPAAWRQLKFLLTDLSCDAQGTCDLAAGTTIGGSPIGAGGGGDNVSVNGIAVVDPDFKTVGSEITFVDTANVITALIKDSVTVTGWILGTLGAGFTTGGDITMADHDIINPDAIGADIYYVDSVAEAQAALTRCGSDLTGSVQSGCIVQFTGGLFDNGGVTLNLAGTGSNATGRAGVILRGVGGGTAAGAAGNPNSGTILKASGAVPVIDIGSCAGCMIENLTIAGEDIATVGVDFLAPTGSAPTTRFVMRNVSMYEVNGFCIRTPTTGQVDTMIFENVSCRDSDGAFQQRDSQTVGVILTNFDANMLGTASGPVFDIQEGDFTMVKSYLAIKNNEVGIRLGTAASRVVIDNNQLEYGASTTATLFDFDEGSTTTESNITVSNNHIVYGASGNVLFDVQRKGSMSILTNSWQDTVGGLTEPTSDFMVDDSNADNRLYLQLVGNMSAHAGSGGTKRPERWAPTLTANPTHVVLPTLGGVSVAAHTLPTPCLNGEIGIDTNATTGQRVQTCEAGTWTTLGFQPLDSDLTSIAALTTTTGGRSILASTPADDQVYVGDTASAGTWRSVPDCGEAGTLNYTAATNTFSCLTDSGGGGNSVEVSLAITANGSFFSTTVTGQTWVASGSEIVCTPFGTTADGLTVEAVTVGALDFSVSDKVAGTGFNLNVWSPNGLEGTVRAHCVGV